MPCCPRGAHIVHGHDSGLASWVAAKNAILAELGDIQHATEQEKEEKVRRLFDKIDKDGSGEITYELLVEAMSDFGVIIEESTLKRMMSHADKNQDGFIKWDEFLPLIKELVLKG
jgi:Ca2+-binding EF-hand superfamily protein